MPGGISEPEEESEILGLSRRNPALHPEQRCTPRGHLKVSTFWGVQLVVPAIAGAGWSERLKIVIFGLTISSSWGNGHATPYRAIVRALHRRGHQVSFYEKDQDYYARRRDFDSAPYCKLVLYPAWDSVRGKALKDAADADAVIAGSYCPEGARINDELLPLPQPLRVFYDLDAPITLQKLGGPGVDYLRREQMPEFDLYLSFTGGSILEELERKFRVRMARPLFGCVDPDAHGRVPQRHHYRCLLSYMGTYAADRQQKVEKMFVSPARERPHGRFVLAGSLYPGGGNWPANVSRFEHVPPRDHPALFSSSRLTLNVTRDGMARFGYCPSGRFFEAAACGTPIVSDWWEGLDRFFIPGEELFAVRDTEDVLHALDAPDEELHRISKRARERTLAEYTGDRRAEELLAYFEEARQAKAKTEVMA